MKGLSVAKNCIRPESAPLIEISDRYTYISNDISDEILKENIYENLIENEIKNVKFCKKGIKTTKGVKGILFAVTCHP